jgi:hypothetical protein
MPDQHLDAAYHFTNLLRFVSAVFADIMSLLELTANCTTLTGPAAWGGNGKADKAPTCLSDGFDAFPIWQTFRQKVPETSLRLSEEERCYRADTQLRCNEPLERGIRLSEQHTLG